MNKSLDSDTKTTTLAKINSHNPSQELWNKLLVGLGKVTTDDEPLPYALILKICGLHDALWATRTEDDFEWVRKLAIVYAKRAQRRFRSLRGLEKLRKIISEDTERVRSSKSASSCSFYTCCIADFSAVSLVDDKPDAIEREWQEAEFLKFV